MNPEEQTRKASLSPQVGGMSDVQLRRYNTPNNDGYVFSDDPIYMAFPELREKMEARTLTKKEYDAAMDAYTAERIILLVESDSRYMRQKREEMFDRSRPLVLKDGFGNPWVHPTHVVPRYAAH